MYKIVLYNNGKKVKTFRTYNLYSNAIKKYRGMLKDNSVFFPKQFLWDGSKTDYELVLTAPQQNKPKEYFRDNLGAAVKIVPKGDFSIKQVEKYSIEDSFKNKVDNKKYNFKTLIKKILSVKGITYTLIVINNKLVVERFENDELDVFVLKNKDATYLLFETIKSFNDFILSDICIIKTFKIPQRDHQEPLRNERLFDFQAVVFDHRNEIMNIGKILVYSNFQ